MNHFSSRMHNLSFLLLPSLSRYAFKHHQKEEAPLKENPSGCARAERFRERAPLDMFSWLASQHRSVPHPRDAMTAG